LTLEDNRIFVKLAATEHGRRLKRYLARRLRNPADAPDLAQEVYLRLLRVQRAEEIRNPEAYLLTVASHLVREHAVKSATAPSAVSLDELAGEGAMAGTEDPGSQADTQQRLDALERALGKVSAKASAVLVLVRRDGFTLDEVAAQLGISRSMVKKYLTAALSHCRQQLERSGRR
jgi:RNA polymerase sigma-70 factor (ECF subfamily)